MKNIDRLFDFTVMVILAILWIPFNETLSQDIDTDWDTEMTSDLETESLTEDPEPLMMVGKQLSTISTYCNDRFEFCMAYPSDILTPIWSGDNSDGKVFASEDNNIHVWVYGTHSLNWTIENEYDRILAELDLLAQNANHDFEQKTWLADDYFIIHRWLDDQQYYQKTFLRDDQFITISFQASFAPIKGELIQDVRQKVVDSVTL